MSKIAKLTLSVPAQILKEAKRYAKIHGTSVSAIVTRLFESLSEIPAEKNGERSGAVTKASTGMISLPANSNKSTLIADALSEKLRK